MAIKKLFYDVETTGLDYRENAIHQLSGCIEIDGTVVEEFNFRMQPHSGAVIVPKALEVSNVTEEQIMAYEPSEAVFAKFMAMVSRYVQKFVKTDKMYLVGYNNCAFDNAFLRRWYEIHMKDDYFNSWFFGNTLDVMVLASEYLLEKRVGMENFKLMTVARAVGIEIDESKLHDAQYDIELTRTVYKIVTNRFSTKPEIYGVLDEMPF
jgi:DNA polymerase-3 subunit epsilon